MAYSEGEGITRRNFSITNKWIPRKCFICGEKGGWGKKNVSSIHVREFERPNYYCGEFHLHCLKDAICCPENYDDEVVNKAVNVFEMIEKIHLKEAIDKKFKKLKLKILQKKIYKGE